MMLALNFNGTYYKSDKDGCVSVINTEKHEILHHGNTRDLSMETHTRQIADAWRQHKYYDDAEFGLKEFWSGTSIFNVKFKSLDLTNVLELACGHGRHVPYYIKKANNIILMDVNVENIDFCKKRFEESKIKYYVNSGSDFSQISDDSLTAIFTYDAMVHFELYDVASYVRDAYRVLKPGGKILFHHSNNDSDPLKAWGSQPHARNFLSAQIFAYFADRAGFKILSQDLLDWGGR